jgi:hypothetical protein
MVFGTEIFDLKGIKQNKKTTSFSNLSGFILDFKANSFATSNKMETLLAEQIGRNNFLLEAPFCQKKQIILLACTERSQSMDQTFYY